MISLEDARAIAIGTAGAVTKEALVLLDGRTLEREFGWVFFYQSEQYVRTGAESMRLYGNAPIIVDRRTGRATVTGTAFPIEDYLVAYEALGAERFERGEWRTFLRSKIEPIE